MTTQSVEFETFAYPGRNYDGRGEPVGVGPWVHVLSGANRMAAESGDVEPFLMPEREPWGADPDLHVEQYPEARVVIHLAEDPTEDRVEVIALSERVAELLRRADAEVTA